MAILDVKTIPVPDGYDFLRSDGERFFLAPAGSAGNAVLYKGQRSLVGNVAALVEFDYSVIDKAVCAIPYILAHPDLPDHVLPADLSSPTSLAVD